MVEQSAEQDHERVRVAFTMPRTDYEQMKTEADREGQTVAALIRQAVATRRYLDGRVHAGATVLVEEGGVQREVVFR